MNLLNTILLTTFSAFADNWTRWRRSDEQSGYDERLDNARRHGGFTDDNRLRGVWTPRPYCVCARRFNAGQVFEKPTRIVQTWSLALAPKCGAII